MQINDYNDLRRQLASESDETYREFAMKGIPSERPFIGVRIPKIRELAYQIPKSKIDEFLSIEPIAIEEVLVRGFLIAALPYEEMLTKFDSQINFIDNWCTCDTFCASPKSVKNHKPDFLDAKIDQLLESGKEFAVRTGLVLLKCYYVDFDYLGVIFDRTEHLTSREEYYIKMALAWLIAECFIKLPDETFGYLQTTKMPKWTFNKTISKICDSYRVDEDAKTILRKMRKAM